MDTCLAGTVKTITKDEYNRLVGTPLPDIVKEKFDRLSGFSLKDKLSPDDFSMINTLKKNTDWQLQCSSQNNALQEQRNRYRTCNLSGKPSAVCSASVDYPQIKLCDRSAVASKLSRNNAVVLD